MKTSWGLSQTYWGMRTSSRKNLENVQDIYPLTPAQEGMLFHYLQDPSNPSYLVQLNFELRGTFDESAFRESWKQVMERHPILRTLFLWEGTKQPLQVVREQVSLPIEVTDLTLKSPEEQQQHISGQALKLQQTAISLKKAPVFRIYLSILSPGKAHFIWHSHHILLDGWSFNTIRHEVAAIYEGLLSEKPVELPQAIPFKDHVAWLQSQDRQSAKLYWEQALKGFFTPTNIPDDFADPQVDPKYEKIEYDLNPGFSQQLREFAKSGRITLNSLFQGAWAQCLSAYGNSDDVVFGITLSGRSRELFHECMAGMFITTLPLRVRFNQSDKVFDWLRSIQEQMVVLYDYQHSYLTDIKSSSQLDSKTSLFETVLVFENYPISDSSAQTALQWEVTDVTEYSHYPLVLEIIPTDSIIVRALFNASRYKPETIQLLLSQLNEVLDCFINNWQLPIEQLPLMCPSTYEEVVTVWNQTHRPLVTNDTIATLLVKQASNKVHYPALIMGSQKMSYGELYRRASIIAGHLSGQGLKSGARIGVAIPRSFDMIVALAAAVLAGATYVPLDPTYPKQRLEYIISDSRLSWLMTVKQVENDLPANDVPKIFLDNFDYHRPPRDFIPVENRDLYLSYTSGSTGRPKGVLGTEKGLLNRLSWQWRNYPVQENEVFCQKTTLNFVDHLWEIWGALLSGATLLLVPDEQVREGEGLLDILQDHRIYRIVMVPSYFLSLLSAYPEKLKKLSHIKYWTLSGEAVYEDTIKKFDEVLPQSSLLNFYGMSECSIDASIFDQHKHPINHCPIGRPIDNTKVYILDRNSRPTPVNVPGEIHISGIGLSPGYVNAEDNGSAFIPNPFEKGVPYHRMYRSGDLGRWLPNGTLEYLGRKDQQIKIRGIRIEPKEIEQVLEQHQLVERALVLGVSRGQDDYLLAYVLSPGQPPLEEMLKLCRDQLPDYMVPAGIQVLKEFFYTPNGKIDRLALPDPVMTKPRTMNYTPPGSPLEKNLVQIWSEFFNQQEMDIKTSIFKLGADSLSTIRLVSRMKNEGIVCTVRQLFEHPTVSELARILDDNK